MNYLFLIIILVSMYIFKRQEKKHQSERELFYTYEQLQSHMTIPKRDILESLLVFFVGTTLLEIGGVFLWVTAAAYAQLNETINDQTNTVTQKIMPQQFTFAVLLLGAGSAMIILGIKSIIMNIKYKRSLQG